MKNNYYECPACHQDMRAKPHEGLNGENCKKCGQGLFWRVARLQKRANKACSGLATPSTPEEALRKIHNRRRGGLALSANH